MSGTATHPRVEPPVYGTFYGLQEPPFSLSPDPRFLCLTPQHREVQATLHLALTTPRGFTLVIGEAGTGKTTMAHAAVAALLDSEHQCLLMTNPTLERSEFYDFLARRFGLSRDARISKIQFFEELQPLLGQRIAAGGLTSLIVDEAQSLSHQILEEVRLLGNMEGPGYKFLNVVLLGQPELAERLEDPSLRQLKQRFSLRCELTPFDLQDAASYIAGRLRIAGGEAATIFTRDAVMAIYRASSGLPRVINVICDNALISGFANQTIPVTASIVDEIARDFRIA